MKKNIIIIAILFNVMANATMLEEMDKCIENTKVLTAIMQNLPATAPTSYVKELEKYMIEGVEKSTKLDYSWLATTCVEKSNNLINKGKIYFKY